MFGTSAGTQDLRTRSKQADVILVIGANPTDGAPGLRLAHEDAGCAAGRAS